MSKWKLRKAYIPNTSSCQYALLEVWFWCSSVPLFPRDILYWEILLALFAGCSKYCD